MSKITETQTKAEKLIADTADLQALEKVRVEILGRKGLINKLLATLSKEELKEKGREINEIKNKLSEDLKAAEQRIIEKKDKKAIDVTIPGIKLPLGSRHPINKAIEEIEDIFARLSFVRRRYGEVETDWYYAEGLNIPKDHPARDDQETFYVDKNKGIVLTAHTSNGQLREMEKMGKPPIRMINIGKTYRRQADASHAPMFHQFEGLVVDKGINITHLIGVSNYFVQEYFGKDRKIRLRPHHFQFTEPSFEVDINCGICKGTGRVGKNKCKLCKAGWLELGGAGMVHPTVLKNGGIDPTKYSGFAFGWGVERVWMMKTNVIDDLRDLYATDINFLQQFS